MQTKNMKKKKWQQQQQLIQLKHLSDGWHIVWFRRVAATENEISLKAAAAAEEEEHIIE